LINFDFIVYDENMSSQTELVICINWYKKIAGT